jgi:hypothetical protein
MITSADAYVGKSFKYLAIYDKSLRKFVINPRPEDGTLTVDYLVDILTPGSLEEIPTSIISSKMSENSLNDVLSFAKERVVTLINVLQANYWDVLTEVVYERKKWTAVLLFAQFILRGDRTSRVIYNLLTELYVHVTVLRTAEDGVDMSISYESSLAY